MMCFEKVEELTPVLHLIQLLIFSGLPNAVNLNTAYILK